MSLHNLDIGLQGTGGLDGLEDADHVAGRHAKGIKSRDEARQGGPALQPQEAPTLLFGG